MHEFSITQNILNIALRHANGATAITDIYLVIGQLSSYVDESIQFYWPIISEGTIAENAKLHFQQVAAELECKDCHYVYHLDGENLACPACGSIYMSILAGEEFFVESIEVDRKERA